MKLKDIYAWYAKEGYVVAVPNGNLTLYDYTTQCELKGNWNYHTRSARGLVLDDQSNVLARPFPKFFNFNEREEVYEQNLPQNEIPEIAEKLDGSLVIIFQANRVSQPSDSPKWVAVTRRSWNNQQSKWANNWLIENQIRLKPFYTYCFELIAPWNQVVVKYPTERLVLTGMIDQYGNDLSYQEIAAFADAQKLDVVSFFRQEISLIDVEDISHDLEGYVARFSTGLRVKIKAPWYLAAQETKEFKQRFFAR